jgi:hypothetical protein
MTQETVLRWSIVAAAAGAPAAALVLSAVEPTEASWLPSCPLFRLTGLHCPFCGSTRCVHALLHGDVAQAAAFNSLALFLLPLAAFYLYACAWASLRNRPLPTWNPPKWVPRLLLAVIASFGILRNLPVYPFPLLAPRKL